MPAESGSLKTGASGARLKLWLHRAGTLAGAAGIVFVALKLRAYSGDLRLQSMSWRSYGAMAALALIYGGANLWLARAWQIVLGWLGNPVATRWAVWAYATSQLAKYVPGNVFQFAGRQAIGAAAGLPHLPLAKSTLAELAMLVVAGAFFAPLLLPLHWPVGAVASVFAFAAAGAVLLCGVAAVAGRRLRAALACYFAFLAISGLVFAALIVLTGGLDASRIAAVAGAYVIAWLAGLVTPGAPAGLGVREAVLLYLLHGVAAPPVILLAVVAGRGVTVVGDFLFYAAGQALRGARP